MNNPEYIKIGDKKYKINTDFRVAIRCDEISRDKSIGQMEKISAMIYLLFGEEALRDTKNYDKFIELGTKYLLCGEEPDNSNIEPDMDFVQDMGYIEASFMSDFNIDLENTEMHWWKFMKLMNGLSNSELGNCCVLNQIRNLRTIDVSQIKDEKERQKIIKAKQKVALKKEEKEFTKKQQDSMNKFYELAGLNRKE